MVTQVAPNLYRIPVPLPGNPLKNLNAYLIRGHRNLLVDTGFRQEACRMALKAGWQSWAWTWLTRTSS